MTELRKVLIANRGEIAVRITRATASLQMQSVAIYAEADKHNLHTRVCDTAVILPADTDPIAAYLNIDNIIAIAKAEQCDCIHPGYGFLSENPELAKACDAAGIHFVGPNATTLELFGDKISARRLAEDHNIPTIPGSNGSTDDVAAAISAADGIGYPVMLKAAAGGGGRGIRRVNNVEEMRESFERCQGEAQAAFADGRVFVEKLIQQPRHIEVQILADQHGNVVHLGERDCSLQMHHQKVVECAPAPNLHADLRGALLADALKLADAVQYQNAGTVEFLVDAETDGYFFIECNPRIQVEHTVTEAVMGVDLVASQLQIAGGASLTDLRIPEAATPRGYAIQCRVVSQGTGTLTAYREPSGMGVRVDAHGYPGYAPPNQFDPLLAKVIVHSLNADFGRAIDLAGRTLDEFHIAGVPTNLPLLRAILDDSTVRAGAAKTDFLTSFSPPSAEATSSGLQALFEETARSMGTGRAKPVTMSGKSGLTVPVGNTAVEAPMQGTILSILVSPGDILSAGDTVMVISAMKMETAITAPVSGKLSQLDSLREGDSVNAGQVVCLMEAAEEAPTQSSIDRENSWLPTLDEVSTLQRLAAERLSPASEEPGVVRQRNRGKLNCRERIDMLLDTDTFREVGSLAGFASYDDYGEINAFTPANHVGGWGEIDDRTTVVCADDFTSRGGHADGAIGAKSMYLDRLSVEMRVPSVRLLDGSSGGGSVAAMVPQQKKDGESDAKESSGAIKAGRPRVAGGGGSFLPGHLGSNPYSTQLNTVPVVNMLLGSVVGIGAAKAVLGHFSVMVRDIAQLFVAGPPVVSHAMGYDITKEELGGWHIHCTNGSVDNLAESEAEAVAMSKHFLSYLPGSVYEPPPVIPCSDPNDRVEEELLTIIPRKRTTTFDIRRAIRLMADKDSFFEIGPYWGTDQVTGFVRCNGHPLGVIASDSRHENGGALTADGCDKLKRHLDLCDTFHIPLLNLVDNPGFAVGLEHEMASTIRKGGEWMVAFAQVSMPMFSVLMRRSFGVAGNNYATPQSRPSVRVTWPAADVGGIPPEGGIEAAYKRQLAEADDPIALRAELEARIESARGPIGPLNRFQIEEMIDPRETRRLICEWVPTAYRIVNQQDRLGPRALQFRP